MSYYNNYKDLEKNKNEINIKENLRVEEKLSR